MRRRWTFFVLRPTPATGSLCPSPPFLHLFSPQSVRATATLSASQLGFCESGLFRRMASLPAPSTSVCVDARVTSSWWVLFFVPSLLGLCTAAWFFSSSPLCSSPTASTTTVGAAPSPTRDVPRRLALSSSDVRSAASHGVCSSGGGGDGRPGHVCASPFFCSPFVRSRNAHLQRTRFCFFF